MATFIRAKRVSDPLDDKVKAQLRGDDHIWSSGSEHDAAADPSCLSGLVHAFLETDCTAPSSVTLVADGDATHHGGLDEDGEDPYAHAVETVSDLLDSSRGERIHSDACAAAEALAGLRSCGSGYRRGVMGRLREAGYNAGICNAKWETSGGLTAGNYEYIDIVVEADIITERYVVDPDFAAQFEVARTTAEYSRLLAVLPRVMVGRAEEVRKAVRAVSEAGRRSLRSQGLSVPPWRKTRYMLAKWFGPYRRTVNEAPSSTGAPAAGRDIVRCRAVGFEVAAAVNGSMIK